MSEILLEVKNFNVILDGSPILSRLGFSVAEGEFLTILSPNESGKTVLSRALLDLMPYDGELSWRKQPRIRCLPRGLDQIYLRDLPLTVKDFFALKKPNPGEVLKCLSLLGLEGGVLNKRAGHLSGGEFQRMLVAWVPVSHPNVRFLDEPTSAVDLAGGKTIYSLLRNTWREKKLTILNVTHDLNIVFAHSTHVLCLSRFGHHCYGVLKEVLTPGVLNDIYGSNVKFYIH